MDTSRISSGFDIELQLGGGWFLTAIQEFSDNGLLGPPGVIISDVQITFEPGWDLQITVAGFSDPFFARAELSVDGKELTLTSNIPGIDPTTIPFGVLDNLAAPPTLVKRAGDADHEPAMILLANMKIHAEAQSEEPRADDDPLPRGNADDAVSFLPIGKHIAFGIGKETFSRFANNLWHGQLRAEDGTHPLPDADNKKGDWSKVTMTPQNGKIKVVLEGDIPVDSPIIDVIPDPHVTITLTLTPVIADGKLSFKIDTDTDIDTGLLGDLFGALTGGIVGLIIGAFTGGILAGLLIGAVIGVVVIEVAEVVVEGEVQKIIKAKLDGQPLPEIHCTQDGIVEIAQPASSDEGFNLSVLDAIPSSIPVSTENPADEYLYKLSLLVTSVYDDMTVDADGFAVCGTSSTAEKFQPEIVSITNFIYDGDRLASIEYKRNDGQLQTLTIEEVFSRVADAELQAPFKLFTVPDGASLRIPEGKLACVCLVPTAISEDKTVVQQIEFENGLRIKVPDAIALQDAGAIVVLGYQLIHPRDYNAYYRAKADFFLDNNFESLPKF